MPPIHLFTPRHWNVAVLDHVLDLAFHGHEEEDEEVHEEDGPEHGEVKDAKKGEQDAEEEGLEDSVPASRVTGVTV